MHSSTSISRNVIFIAELKQTTISDIIIIIDCLEIASIEFQTNWVGLYADVPVDNYL